MSEALKATLISQNKYEQFVETLQKIHDTEMAIRELDVYSLNATHAVMTELSYKFRVETTSLRGTFEACDTFGEVYKSLQSVTNSLNCTIPLNSNFPCDSIEFNAKMIRSIEFFYEEEWVSNDEGGSEVYLGLTRISLNLDEDVLLALNPQLITDEYPVVDMPELTDQICRKIKPCCRFHSEFLHEFGAIHQNQFIFNGQPVSYLQMTTSYSDEDDED